MPKNAINVATGGEANMAITLGALFVFRTEFVKSIH
jgi:hypothetical protein